MHASSFTLRACRATAASWCLALLAPAGALFAQTTYYWDIDGATAGAGGATPGGTWDGTTANWTTDAEGGSATTTPAAASILVFAAGNDATGAYTVTRNGSPVGASALRFEEGTVTLAGGALSFSGAPAIEVAAGATAILAANAGGTGALQFTGDGTLRLSNSTIYGDGASIAGGTLVFGNTVSFGSPGTGIVNDGELVSEGTLNFFVNLYADISGTGSLRRTGGGALTLHGTHTYTGGTKIDAGTGLQIGNNGTQGSIVGDVVNDGALTFFRSDDIAFAGNISGAGTLRKEGAGVLTLEGSNIYTGTTTVGNGTLRAGAAGALPQNGGWSFGSTASTLDLNGHDLAIGAISGPGAILLGDATLTITPATPSALGAAISGTGALIKQGAVNLTLSAANTYTGGTTVSAGTLSLGLTAGAVAGDIANSGTVAFIRTNDTTYGGVISGTGAVTKSSNTVLTFTGDHTYTGTTTVNFNGGTLQVGNGGTSGSLTGNVVLNSATVLRFNRSDDSVYPGLVSGTGGAVTKLGDGTLALTGASTHTGGTTVSGGILQIGNGGATGSLTGAVTVNAGGSLGFNRSDSFPFASVVSGDGTLTQAGTGTVILSGASTYTGGTIVSSGTLQVGNNTASSGAATGSIVGDVTVAADANLTFARGSVAVTFPGVIGGEGSVTKSGTGVLTFTSSDHDYTGGTIISAGTLNLGNGGTTGSIQGDVAIGASNATLVFNRSDDIAFAGVIDGPGAVRKEGANTLTLTGANTYTGATTVNAGVIEFPALNAFGSGVTRNLTLNGGTLRWAAGTSADISSRLAVMGASGGKFDTNGNDVVFASTANNNPARPVEKLGAGTLTLANTFSNTSGGPFTVSAGALQIGDGGTTGSLTATLVNNAAVIFNRSDNLSHSLAISGTGSLTKLGAGNLTLTGSNTYTGGTTISEGTLTLSNIAIAGDIVNNAALVGTRTGLSTGTSIFANTISGTGTFAKTGTGIVVLSGANTYEGGTAVTGGFVEFASDGAFGTGAITLNGGGLRWTAGTATDISSRLTAFGAGGGKFDTNGSDVLLASDVDAAGSPVEKLGSGTLTLAADFANPGGTFTVTAGVLQIGDGDSGSLTGNLAVNGAAGVVFHRNGDVLFPGAITGAGAITKLGPGALRLGNTSGYSGATTISAGTLFVGNDGLPGNVVNNATLAFENTAGLAFGGVISGSGAVTKSGAGTLTLTGANTYTGPTTITGGLIAFSAPDNFGTGTVTLDGGGLRWAAGNTADLSARLAALGAAGGTFDTNGNDLILATALTGAGGLTKTGAGALALTADNTYAGDTTVLAGSLHLGNGGTAGSVAGDILNDAEAVFDRSDDVDYAGVISGTGAVTKHGDGALTLTGASTYEGGTVVAAGTLIVNNTAGSGTGTGLVTVEAGATLAGTGAIGGDVLLAAGGRLAPGTSPGTLTIDGDLEWTGSADGSATFFFGLDDDSADSDRIAIGGALLEGAGPDFAFDFQGTGAAGATYTLATFASTDFDLEDFAFTNLGPGLGGAFSFANNGTELQFTTLAAPVITSPATAAGTFGIPFSYAITASNLPVSFSVTGALPAGLAFDPATGLVTGTPAETGTFNVTLGATNAIGTGTAPLVLTIAKAAATVTLSSLDPTFDGGAKAAIVTTNPPGLTTTVTYDGSPTAPSAAGSYMVVATIDEVNYAGSASGTLTIAAPPPPPPPEPTPASVTLGNLDRIFDGTPKPATVTTEPAGLSVSVTYNGGAAAPSAVGSYTVVATVTAPDFTGSGTGMLVIAAAPPPVVDTPPATVTTTPGGPASFNVVPTGPGPFTYQWQKDGVDIPGATGPALTLPSAQPGDVGLYSAKVTANGVTTITEAAPLGLEFPGKLTGAGEVVGTDIRHPNGNIYDQVQLTGSAVSVKADPGQVLRVSYVDLSDDIVQVEFSGAGILTVSLENASGPAAAVNYNQPGVAYMKGHATVTITGGDAISYLTIFSVGKITAVNQELFRAGVAYDGFADLARVQIASADGKFAELRLGNAGFFATQGHTGIHAPGVQFAGPVYVHDIGAADAASPVLRLGAADDVRINGGSLRQDNNAPVEVSGMTRLQFTGGQDAHGNLVPAQANRARLVRDGVDVTEEIVEP